MYKYVRPLNSHGFTVCHTVSLPFSRSRGRFFISHRFTNFKWIFSQTHNSLRKQTRQQSPVKKYRSIFLYIEKKNNNSVIFDLEASIRSFPRNSCRANHQKLYEKHPSSISRVKALFSGIVFVITWKFLRTAIKNDNVGVFLLKKHTI